MIRKKIFAQVTKILKQRQIWLGIYLRWLLKEIQEIITKKGHK